MSPGGDCLQIETPEEPSIASQNPGPSAHEHGPALRGRDVRFFGRGSALSGSVSSNPRPAAARFPAQDRCRDSRELACELAIFLRGLRYFPPRAGSHVRLQTFFHLAPDATGARVTACDIRVAIFGVVRGAFEYRLEGQGRVLGGRFRPGGFRGLLEAPLATIIDRTIALERVFELDAAAAEALVFAADDDAGMIQAAQASDIAGIPWLGSLRQAFRKTRKSRTSLVLDGRAPGEHTSEVREADQHAPESMQGTDLGASGPTLVTAAQVLRSPRFPSLDALDFGSKQLGALAKQERRGLEDACTSAPRNLSLGDDIAGIERGCHVVDRHSDARYPVQAGLQPRIDTSERRQQ
jgi:hypothetical protein